MSGPVNSPGRPWDSAGATRQGEDTEAIEKLFTPEFRNRLDAIVSFSSLTIETVGHVVDKFIGELGTQLAERKVSISLSPQAREWLCRHGYDETYGARPLARVIQEHVKKPLADELLFGDLVGGGACHRDRDRRRCARFREAGSHSPCGLHQGRTRAGKSDRKQRIRCAGRVTFRVRCSRPALRYGHLHQQRTWTRHRACCGWQTSATNGS